MAQQMVAQTKTRETWDGGYAHMMRRVEREQPTPEELLDWRLDLWDTPKSERGPFWMGQWDAADAAFDAAVAKGA